jgi:hypothetical protein
MLFTGAKQLGSKGISGAKNFGTERLQSDRTARTKIINKIKRKSTLLLR